MKPYIGPQANILIPIAKPVCITTPDRFAKGFSSTPTDSQWLSSWCWELLCGPATRALQVYIAGWTWHWVPGASLHQRGSQVSASSVLSAQLSGSPQNIQEKNFEKVANINALKIEGEVAKWRVFLIIIFIFPALHRSRRIKYSFTVSGKLHSRRTWCWHAEQSAVAGLPLLPQLVSAPLCKTYSASQKENCILPAPGHKFLFALTCAVMWTPVVSRAAVLNAFWGNVVSWHLLLTLQSRLCASSPLIKFPL